MATIAQILSQRGLPPLPETKPCPECGGTLRLDTQVEPDDILHGETGDFELATTYSIIYECETRGCHYVEVVDSETKGTGILR